MKKKALLMIVLLLTFVQGTWAENVTFNVRSWYMPVPLFSLA